MATDANTKIFTNLAGEFLVAAELNRRHILRSVTYGASKSADVFAFNEDSGRVVRVEVKSTDKMRGDKTAWVIGQRGIKAGATEHIWIFVLLPDPLDKRTDDDCERGRHTPRFFVLTGAEVQELGEEAHEEYNRKYQAKHGEPYPSSPLKKAHRWHMLASNSSGKTQLAVLAKSTFSTGC
jgi:hypothetical protein